MSDGEKQLKDLKAKEQSEEEAEQVKGGSLPLDRAGLSTPIRITPPNWGSAGTVE